MERIGLIGLGVMGQNLSLNLADHALQVVGFDQDSDACHRFSQQDQCIAVDHIAELVTHLTTKPRVILLLLPAGPSVDEQWEALLPLLSPGDIIVDGGNAHYQDSARRAARLAESGVAWVGLGISGGKEGARHGPSLMAGGSDHAVNEVRRLLLPIVAHVRQMPCFVHCGPAAAGHFVKMVHNGIEYADMQMIAEAFFLLRHLSGHSPAAIGEIFHRWQQGPLSSYLLEISATILAEVDSDSGLPLVDAILDVAGQKGTGHWATTAAMALGVAVPTIGEAVHARHLSSLREERLHASKRRGQWPKNPAHDFCDAIHAALLAGRICAYAQGFALLAMARQTFAWPIDLAAVAHTWQGGCIIRARLLQDVQALFSASPDLTNLLMGDALAGMVMANESLWRQTLCAAMSQGLPVPALASALAYWDGYHAPRLWADLIQAQRHHFGGHGFPRPPSGNTP